MKLEKALFQKSDSFFALFFLFMLAGFWLTYFTTLSEQENYRMHLHGITLIAWCILLVLQPYLIRTKNYQLHRQVGKLSYVVVGLITLTTLDIYMYRLRGLDALSTQDYLSASSVLIALLTFLVFYGLAIFYKSKPGIHARYMVCTVFALFTAVFDRMIDSYFSFLLNYFPSVDGQPVRQVFGLTLADTILFALCIWDWTSHRRWNVFPVALLIHLSYHYSVLHFYQFNFWQSFCNWFFELAKLW